LKQESKFRASGNKKFQFHIPRVALIDPHFRSTVSVSLSELIVFRPGVFVGISVRRTSRLLGGSTRPQPIQLDIPPNRLDGDGIEVVRDDVSGGFSGHGIV
jgi:hypothetical protein